MKVKLEHKLISKNDLIQRENISLLIILIDKELNL